MIFGFLVSRSYIMKWMILQQQFSAAYRNITGKLCIVDGIQYSLAWDRWNRWFCSILMHILQTDRFKHGYGADISCELTYICLLVVHNQLKGAHRFMNQQQLSHPANLITRWLQTVELKTRFLVSHLKLKMTAWVLVVRWIEICTSV